MHEEQTNKSIQNPHHHSHSGHTPSPKLNKSKHSPSSSITNTKNNNSSQLSDKVPLAQEEDNDSNNDLTFSIKQQLNDAKQILPANVHRNVIQKVKVSIEDNTNGSGARNGRHLERLGVGSYGQLNRTAVFPGISRLKKSLGNKGRGGSLDLLSQQLDGEVSPTVLKQQMGCLGVFLNEDKRLIYQRIRNEKLNYISRSEKMSDFYLSENNQGITKHFCSVFINPKTEKNHSKSKPIYEHLAKVYELPHPKLIEDNLTFSSRFQGGNLFAVMKDLRAPVPTYELFLQNDTNTKGSTQWFYFRVENSMRSKVRFRILNFYKPTSLYEQGMKVLVSNDSHQWKRVGIAISYQKSKVQAGSYFLEFLYEFQNSTKPTYFAYGYPYSYNTKLLPYLEKLLRLNYNKKCIQKSVLCKSNMGNPVYLLTISSDLLLSSKKSQKPLIYIIGRQHSGQTPPSYVIEGLIDFLLSNRTQAQTLRDQFQFRIIPMVNVDGVISGNYRANISGCDVNRQWQYPSKALHPEIYYLKQQIMGNKKRTVFFLDIHAHSRKMNSFFYGCGGGHLTNVSSSMKDSSITTSKNNKFYPFVCSKLSKFISFKDSSFGDDVSKQTTGRVVLQKQLNIQNSLTFEISFYGWSDSKKNKIHFKISDFQEIGASLGLAFYYTEISIKELNRNQNQEMVKSDKKSRDLIGVGNNNKIDSSEKQKQIYLNSVKILSKWKTLCEKQLKSQENNDGDVLSDGSSLNPEQFELDQKQIDCIEVINEQIEEKSNMSQKKKSLNMNTSFRISSNRSVEEGRSSEGGDYKSSKQKAINSLKESEAKAKSLYEGTVLADKNRQSNLFSFSGQEFFLMSPKEATVKKLERELQGKEQLSIELPHCGDHQNSQTTAKRLNSNNRYSSLDNEITKNVEKKAKIGHQYQHKVKQMRKAYNYCLNSQEINFDKYKECYKHISMTPSTIADNELSHTRSVFPNRQRKTALGNDFAALTKNVKNFP